MKRQVPLVVLGMLLAPAAFAQQAGAPATAPESAISTPSSQHPDLSPQDDSGFNRGINAQELTPHAPPAPSTIGSGPAAPTARDLAAGDQHMGDMPKNDLSQDMNRQSGSTGPATSGVLAHVEKGSIAKEPKQTTKEMTATALLNRFSQLGFAGVREFKRDGDHYVAEAQTMDGKWVNVTIDPMSGDVRANGPVG